MSFGIKPSNKCVQHFGKEHEGVWNGPYSFVFATDPQPGFIDVVEGGDGSKWEKEVNLTNQFVKHVNKLNPIPKFVCLGGDIANAFPGDEARDHQLEDLKTSFASLNPVIPIFIVPGNHDVGNVPNPKTIQIHKSQFGDDFYSFWLGGIFYIVMNSQYYIDDSECKELANEHSKWLDEQLKCAKRGRVILFMHIPPFVSDPMEEDSKFNIPIRDRIQLLEKLGSGGVETIFSGHCHDNGGGVWESSGGHKITVVVTTAIGAQLGDQSPGFTLVTVGQSDIQHEFVTLDAL